MPQISGSDLLQRAHRGSDSLWLRFVRAHIATGAFFAPAPSFRFAISWSKLFRCRMTRSIRSGSLSTPERVGSASLPISVTPRSLIVERLRQVADPRDRDQSRRKTFAGRSTPPLAGKATHSIATRPSFKHRGSRSNRAIVTGKNRARRPRSFKSRLQYTDARSECRAPIAGKMSKRTELEVYCAGQTEISPRFRIGQTNAGSFQPTFENIFFQTTAVAL